MSRPRTKAISKQDQRKRDQILRYLWQRRKQSFVKIKDQSTITISDDNSQTIISEQKEVLLRLFEDKKNKTVLQQTSQL